MLSRRALFVAALCALLSPAAAGAASPPTLSQEQQRDLAAAADYLNSLSTLQSDFLQISSTGETSEGTILLSRPKNLRIDYKPPTPIVIVANREFLTYVDTELQQINHIPLEDTPAAFLLREEFAFDDGSLTVTSVERGANTLRISVVKSDDPLAGELTLAFSAQPMVLRKWTIVDAQGVVTSLTLINPRFGFPIPEDRFLATFPEFDY